MRIAAGIMLIIIGVFSAGAPQALARAIAMARMESAAAYPSVLIEASTVLVIGLIVGGGTCILLKRAWWWAFVAGLCAVVVGIITVLFPVFTPFRPWVLAIPSDWYIFTGVLVTVLASLLVIFLVKRRGEFQS
ncbi:MAG: hypothetical protein ACLFVD_06690 [Dehalococcoidia bacterium]